MSTAGILRPYKPFECGEDGYPRNWERCQTCDGGTWDDGTGGFQPVCPTCLNHGSLMAAALAERWDRACRERAGISEWDYDFGEHLTSELAGPIRCESCNHPMSEGTWEGDEWSGDVEPSPGSEAWALEHLRAGEEPPRELSMPYGCHPFRFRVHYSSCDGGCNHTGPVRWQAADWGSRWATGEDFTAPDVANYTRFTTRSVEAAWRPVDIHVLGWPNDLSPENLAVLCLRCLAERTPRTRTFTMTVPILESKGQG